ncbi:MAG: exodeoxyribonuclease III [Saprospiraceae bacterium]|jgi:exodeoxyribonuclease-3|nr:exodeoxyribonuclease III [Saprospiraceae bacterium]MBK9564093.1 exodeoxyribonuclease III [Saprospiraceae bacterium]MBP6448453.1 exodeoxyribonuclease III [Saprospiraceae bacterium]
MKLISWNVNGIRAVVGRTFLQQFADMDADIFCLQETKAQDVQVAEVLSSLSGYHVHSNSAEKKGYSGVAIISKKEPISITKDIGITDHGNEGRVISAEFDDFFLVNVYVPNSGEGLKRLDYRGEWDEAFSKYLADLRMKKNIIVTGDFNVAHNPIDLARPKENYNKTSGYTQVEIDGMTKILSKGFTDSFRYLYPDKVQYSFWSVRFGARAKNLGWRIDYFLVDERMNDNIKDAFILDQELGSDHCPIGLILS